MMNYKAILGGLLGVATLVTGFGALALADSEPVQTADPRLSATDQDLVGTLPAIYPGDPGDLPSGGFGVGDKDRADTMKTSFVLVGTVEAFRESIIDAYGVGYVSIEPTQVSEIFEFSFHGDVIVAVDRFAIESNALETRVRVGYSYLGGVGAVQGNGYQGNAFALTNYEMDLPYDDVLRSRLADDDTVSLDLANQGLANSFVGLTAYGDVAQIELISH